MKMSSAFRYVSALQHARFAGDFAKSKQCNEAKAELYKAQQLALKLKPHSSEKHEVKNAIIKASKAAASCKRK